MSSLNSKICSAFGAILRKHQRALKSWIRSEGTSLIELALVLPVFALLAAGAFEFGRVYLLTIDLTSAAEAGAVYGTRAPTDIAGMESAALAGISNTPGLSATATYGCECSDGTSAVTSCATPPICTVHYVNYVDVVATASYSPIIRLPGIPNAYTFQSESRMRSGGD